LSDIKLFKIKINVLKVINTKRECATCEKPKRKMM
jgi:hypothetical protein